MTAQEQALFALHRGNAAFTHSTAVSPCLPSFRRMKTASPPMSYRIVAIGCMYFGHSDKFDGWVELRKGR